MPEKRATWRRFLSLTFALFIFNGFTVLLNAQPQQRITRRVDNNVRVQIPNTTHPAVAVATDLGRVPPDMRMERMLLQLQSSPDQEAALQQLLAEQQDPSSPLYQA